MLKIILSHFLQDLLKFRLKPLVIQLPITSRCNSRCLTCNVWKDKSNLDIDADRLKLVFLDSYLSKVEAVGVNGGEISLYKGDMEKLAEAVISLPRIKSVYIISNGLLTEKLLEILKIWKNTCSEKKIELTLTLSIDGVSDVHNQIRGIPTGFKRTINSLEMILENKDIYCDYVRIGCTISKYNVAYLPEIELTLADYNIPIDFHLAVPNKRIGTFCDAPYSVLEDEKSRLLAAEYFLSKSIQSRKLFDKFKYFSNYYYLLNKGEGRISSCSYQKNDITIDENLNLYLCATASDCIHSLREANLTDLMHSKQRVLVEKEMFKHCNTCVHYSASLPTIKGTFVFLRYLVHNRLSWNYKFKYLAKWQKLY